ncbi:helix-hairpin-helix domain-containing protein [Salinicola sp. DM10]|uniref:helix-hairpin-helix domain-containing protein n=1 Tax=Salinicola sp. DM10 TaxID=2815721 RepID=UPI001A8E7FCB|nr:helix-hairpin-helix domain-containing protein [Salinicola sp. DM10]MCE3025711.1 helix-hairpin-helix domain-containing protein [Salinicola sp. DM10]
MHHRAILASFLAAALAASPAASADITIGSWNLLHFGWNNGKRLDAVADVAKGADLWALQEVMNDQAITNLEHELERQTGEGWSAMTSDQVGRSSYTESYAFVWRDSAVEYTQGALSYLDSADNFAREPYLAEFRDKGTGEKIAIATVHITYGDGRSDRTPEIRDLADIWTWMHEVYPGSDRLITGDFNMPPTDASWQPLRDAGARPAITSGATTLSETNGVYSSLYDNFWFDPDALHIGSAGIVKFPEMLGIDHVTARDIVSDHAPIFLTTGSATAGFDSVTEMSGVSEGEHPSETCIDLNTASASELDELPNVGPARAADIIAGRPWASVSDLSRVDGLGPTRVDQIADSGRVCDM